MSNYAQAIDELLDAQVPVEESRGYDDGELSSDLHEVLGRLTPSPADDPDFGKSPLQIEIEAEAAKEEHPPVKGSGVLELFGDLALDDGQQGDLEADRARAEELQAMQEQQVLTEALADPESYEFEYLPELHQRAEEQNAAAHQEHDQLLQQLRAEAGEYDAQQHQLMNTRATIAQAFAAARAAGDQEAMQQAFAAAQEVDQRAAAIAQARQDHHQRTELAAYVVADETAFRQQQPNYSAAFNYIDQQLDKLATEQYPNTSREQHEQIKNHVRLAFIDRCRQSGISVAEAIYAKALELGYQPVKPSRAVRKASREPDTTGVAQTAPQQAPAAPQRRLTLAEVSAMDPGEFERWWAEFDQRETQKNMPRGW